MNKGSSIEFRYRAVAALQLLLFAGAALLVGCGGGGGSGGGGNPSPDPQGFTIKANAATFEPLARIELTPGTGANAAEGYTIQMDVSGTAGFSAADTITVPGLVQEGVVIASTPVLEMAKGSRAAQVPTSFSIRLSRSSDGATSQPLQLAYDKLSIPVGRRGAPTTLLRTAFKALFVESGGVLATRAASMKPGQLVTATAALSPDESIADIQAEAMLRQVFGYSTIDKPLPASSAAGSRGAVRRQALGLTDGFKSGLDKIFGCMNSQIDAIGGAYGEASAFNCFDVARRAVRDDFITNISNLQSRLASGAAVMTSLVRRGIPGFAGSYVERMVFSAELTETLVDGAQVALTLPDVEGDPGAASDFAFEKLTQIAKRKLYDHVTGNLDDVAQHALNVVNAPDAFESSDLTGLSLDKLRELGDKLSALPSDSQRMEDLAGEFGGAAPTPTEIPFGFGSIPVTGDTPTVASICAAYPELDGQLASAGLGSCESYLKPFFDPVYMQTVLAPILAQATEADIAQLQACASTPDTPACEALIAKYIAMGDQLLAAVSSYQSKTYSCDGGYTSFENSYGSLTCVFGPLVASKSGGSCVPGSNVAPFDVGDSSVCVYYSRDYVQPNRTCRQNYSLVTFQGHETCRWTGLGLSQPAAYSVNVDTGDRATLVD